MNTKTTKTGSHETPARVAQVTINAPAKINLFLELLGKRSDGFHEIETIMATVGIYDQLRFIIRDDDQINLTISGAADGSGFNGAVADEVPTDAIPTDERNLVVRALKALRTRAASLNFPATQNGSRRDQFGCDVILKKQIPSAAGLGGASGNAVAALLGGCKLWNLKLSEETLFELAAELGSDVPFFLHGGNCVCRGRGEIIEPISATTGMAVVIAAPPIGLSTANVFANFVMPQERRAATIAIQSVVSGSPTKIARCLFNRLQNTAMEMSPRLVSLAEAFRGIGCLNHQMSGSGSAWFGLFASHKAARIAARTLSQRLPEVRIFCTQTISHSLIPSLIAP